MEFSALRLEIPGGVRRRVPSQDAHDWELRPVLGHEDIHDLFPYACMYLSSVS